MKVLTVVLVFVAACDMGSARPEPKPAAPASPATTSEPSARYGAPLEEAAPKVALADVAKNPDAFTGKTFATTGVVTAVCQHRGCWMEIKDDAGEAHIKMAGHSFFVPRSASGKKARVVATLVRADKGDDACGDSEHHEAAGKGCKAQAEAQLGRPLAKVELVAQGVELL